MSNNSMKILSQISRKYKDKFYRKFLIIIPKKLLDDLGWKAGQELKENIINGELVINKA